MKSSPTNLRRKFFVSPLDLLFLQLDLLGPLLDFNLHLGLFDRLFRDRFLQIVSELGFGLLGAHLVGAQFEISIVKLDQRFLIKKG